MSELEMSHPCPRCKEGAAEVAGGRNEIDYIRCAACGYSGDHFEEDGVVYDIGCGLDDVGAYVRRYYEIASEPANVELAARTRAARLAEREQELANAKDSDEPFW